MKESGKSKPDVSTKRSGKRNKPADIRIQTEADLKEMLLEKIENSPIAVQDYLFIREDISLKKENGVVYAFSDEGIPLHVLAWDKKIERIQSGISKADLMLLKEKFDFTLEELSRILDITPRTIQGKKPSDKFTGHVAERVLALAGIFSYGLEVFEEEEKFKRWLNCPNPIVKNFKPVELLNTMTGMEEVRHLIGRIDYGVY